MPHRRGWLCTSCSLQLGELVGGAVRVWAPLPLIGPDRAAVTCPRCGSAQVWERDPPPRREVHTAAR